MSDNGDALLCDFGLATDGNHHFVLNTMSTFAGTYAYMAPELLSGDGNSQMKTPANDVYAFGILTPFVSIFFTYLYSLSITRIFFPLALIEWQSLRE